MFDYLVDVLGFIPEFRARVPDGSVQFAGAWWGKVGKGPRVILGDIEEALHGVYDHGDFGVQMTQHPHWARELYFTTKFRTSTGCTHES